MLTELIPLSFEKIMQTRAYTVIVLSTPEKKFAIYTDPSVGGILQMYLTGVEKSRPLTHDLLNMIFQATDIRVKQIVLVDVQDTVYFARLFIEQTEGSIRHIIEIDARPSDCIILALMNNAPVFCSRKVLEKTVALLEEN